VEKFDEIAESLNTIKTKSRPQATRNAEQIPGHPDACNSDDQGVIILSSLAAKLFSETALQEAGSSRSSQQRIPDTPGRCKNNGQPASPK
jgi:hypothetical protein